nr:hypothetical protein GCM10020092_028290 [Actinoplanes digitatis]
MTDAPQYAEFGFTDSEWGLLVGLPQSVLTAASVATHDSARKTRAETAAGLDEIADARASASALVAAVAGAVLDLTGDPERGEVLPTIEPADPVGYAQDVLERAAQAAALLAEQGRGGGRGDLQALAGGDRGERGRRCVDRRRPRHRRRHRHRGRAHVPRRAGEDPGGLTPAP